MCLCLRLCLRLTNLSGQVAASPAELPTRSTHAALVTDVVLGMGRGEGGEWGGMGGEGMGGNGGEWGGMEGNGGEWGGMGGNGGGGIWLPSPLSPIVHHRCGAGGTGKGRGSGPTRKPPLPRSPPTDSGLANRQWLAANGPCSGGTSAGTRHKGLWASPSHVRTGALHPTDLDPHAPSPCGHYLPLTTLAVLGGGGGGTQSAAESQTPPAAPTAVGSSAKPDRLLPNRRPWVLYPRSASPRDAVQGKRTSEAAPEGVGQAVGGAVGGGYCRLQMPLKLAFGVRGTVAGYRLGAVDQGEGPLPPPLSNASLGSPANPAAAPPTIASRAESPGCTQWTPGNCEHW